MSDFIDRFVVGNLYSNSEIYKSFNVANAGGLRFRMVEDSIRRAVLMTSVPSARKARENPYHDRIETIRSQLLNTAPERFEHLLKDILTLTGFARIEVTKYSQDGGIDLNAYT